MRTSSLRESAQFQERLRDPDPDVRAYFVAKLMRQAKPDDVFQFVTLSTIKELWPHLTRFLGHSRPFWTWLCIVDLVAEPFAPIEPPNHAKIEETEVDVDSVHEILAAKLSALLGRTELRDLADVQALLNAGADLSAAVRDAPKKDAGFSALTLAWVLRDFDVTPLARALGWSGEAASGAEAFREQLIDRLTQIARPE